MAYGRSRISGYAYCYGKHIVGDYENGTLYELDMNTYTDAGATYRRERVLAPFNGNSLGKAGQSYRMKRFEVIAETGVGLITGQGVDPQIMMSASTDGGRSWSNRESVGLGRLGEYTAKAIWYHMSVFSDLTIRIQMTDPVNLSLHAAAIDVEEAGY
jgi:hypothetical protein